MKANIVGETGRQTDESKSLTLFHFNENKTMLFEEYKRINEKCQFLCSILLPFPFLEFFQNYNYVLFESSNLWNSLYIYNRDPTLIHFSFHTFLTILSLKLNPYSFHPDMTWCCKSYHISVTYHITMIWEFPVILYGF